LAHSKANSHPLFKYLHGLSGAAAAARDSDFALLDGGRPWLFLKAAQLHSLSGGAAARETARHNNK